MYTTTTPTHSFCYLNVKIIQIKKIKISKNDPQVQISTHGDVSFVSIGQTCATPQLP